MEHLYSHSEIGIGELNWTISLEKYIFLIRAV